MSLRWKEIIAQNLLLRDKMKKVLSRAHVRSLEQRARNAHDQNEDFKIDFPLLSCPIRTKNIMCVILNL